MPRTRKSKPRTATQKRDPRVLGWLHAIAAILSAVAMLAKAAMQYLPN